MANSTLSNRPTEESDSPGQEEYEKLTSRYINPDDKDNQAAGNPTDPRSNNAAAGDASDPRDTPDRSELSQAEQIPEDNKVGRGYRRSAPAKKTGAFNWSGFSARKKWAIGAGGGLIGGGLIALFLFFLPMLRLEGYLAGINRRVYAVANNAVSQRIDNLFERYMVTKVLKMQTCGNKITAECKADFSKSGLAGPLFNAWQDARVENRLFEKYGIEVQSYKNKVDGKERFKLIDKDGRFGKRGDELTVKDGKLVLGKFEGGPRIFGQEWSKFIKNETRWDQVLQRKSVRKYLVRKHGTKFWCFFACKTKDSIDNAHVSAKTKLKLKLIEWTVMPFSQKYGLIMQCLTTAEMSKCSPDNLERNGIDRSIFTDQDLADLQKVVDEPNTKLSQLIIEKLLVKIGMDQTTARAAVSAAGGVGLIYLGLSALDTIENMKDAVANGSLGKIAANVNSDQYVEYYAAMRTANDEMKAGALPLDEVGALVSQFNDGGRPAEQSLVYQAYNKPKEAAATMFSGVALAASTSSTGNQSKPYLCNSGQPIPGGMLVCPEKTLNKRGFKIESFFKDANGLIKALDLYDKCYGVSPGGHCIPPIGINPRDAVHQVLKTTNWVINNTLGTVMSATLTLIRKFPPANDLINFATSYIGKFFNSIFNEVFPLPLSPDSPGREKYDALEAGGEITASEFNQGGYTDSGQPYGLGGQLLSEKDNTAAAEAYLQQEDYDNNHDGLINRIASIDNPSSLINRFAMAMPASWGQLSARLGQMFSNPFHNLGFWAQPAYADASTASINAFGVDRFGYKVNDPAFSADPAKYTPEYCDQLNKNWQDTKTDNPVTGTTRYGSTNPCLLEEVAVEAASSAFTQDDSLGVDNSSDLSSGALPTGSAQDLAKQILNKSNITFTTPLARQAITDTAAGNPAKIEARCGAGDNAALSPTLLGVIIKMAENHDIGIGYLTNGCHSANSAHYRGRAVDINTVDGQSVTGGDTDRTFMHEISGILPNGSGIGQQSCSVIPINPINKVNLFDDSCDHIHIQVP